jgi:hypothetical protein
LAALGEAVARGLEQARARTVVDATGDPAPTVASAANAFGADLLLALRLGLEARPCCAYFETEGFRSETGFLVAGLVRDDLATVLARPVDVAGRAYPLLRETRMTAVVCDLARDGDADALAHIVRRSHDVAQRIVRAIQVAYEHPPTDNI